MHKVIWYFIQVLININSKYKHCYKYLNIIVIIIYTKYILIMNYISNYIFGHSRWQTKNHSI